MSPAQELTLYGAAASGSVAVEAALTLLNIPFKLIEGATWASEAARKRVGWQNAMRQIPTLVLPSGAQKYLLGDDLGVLDLYVAVISRFGPWRERFYAEAPRMTAAIRRVDDEPRLRALWTSRFSHG